MRVRHGLPSSAGPQTILNVKFRLRPAPVMMTGNRTVVGSTGRAHLRDIQKMSCSTPSRSLWAPGFWVARSMMAYTAAVQATGYL